MSRVNTAMFTLIFLKSNLVFESWTPNVINAIGTSPPFMYSSVGQSDVVVISTWRYLSKSINFSNYH